MTKRMLIDATHEEETRVAVVDGNQLVEFDYESIVRKQLKGGIYLAKVTRVEPSLQAAFVNFGGNRHGFLPFSEIHPDYFRIPVSDREALLAEQQAELEKIDAMEDEEEQELEAELASDDAEIDDEDEEEDSIEDVVEVGGADKPADDEDADLVAKESAKKKKTSKKSAKKAESKSGDDADEDSIGNKKKDDQEKSDEELDAEALEKAQSLESPEDDEAEEGNNQRRGRGRNRRGRGRGRANMRNRKSDEIVDDGESGKPFRFNLRHKYKIQEVVKRGQIMLIQVSKEERGNKGAAVTTYMSLPGRYCVLMPNSPRGGGVSRKIGNFKDRKRMREILKDLTIPDGMSVILRTAGVARTKAEIKRDLDYLTRLWNTIREDTLKSTAPALINEEGNLIKRSIRDLYTRDIDDVLVSGEEGFKTAKDFMKMLVPSHAKKVKEYKDQKVPLFHKYNVEKQISEIGEISVTLKSGGYLIINPTEALVSIDVNSGKATKERHIEETALKTNLEAAEEVARQLRLRDLGGLVVIDFIDMEERRNNRKVENKLRDALSSDRARIQVGRISSFGLLELSRQRLNPSLTEAQFDKCPHCDGSGVVKTLDFAAISAMRALEEEGIKGKVSELSLNVPNKVAVYILNNKRQMLVDIEERYNFRVHIRVDDSLKASEFRLDAISQRKGGKAGAAASADAIEESEAVEEQQKTDSPENTDKQKKGRRRGRRGGRRHNKNRQQENANEASDNSGAKSADKNDAPKADSKDDKKPSKK
ncbi:MAG TPA: ribonuclease E/G, partial [Alphaproteobacteria bacterium]|nr:ribonuclease E/G [Alphaproteobacteria bacterium]